MATRSRIGVEQADGSIRSIYCHFDGYLDGVGQTLLDHYSDSDKLNQLLDLGDLSSLGPQLDGDTEAYARDRGETGVEAETSANFEEFLKLQESYIYLFSDGRWYTGISRQLLTDAMEQEA